MSKQKNITPEDAFVKIEALASAAQFLAANDNEKSLGMELMSITENIALQAQKDINHVA